VHWCFKFPASKDAIAYEFITYSACQGLKSEYEKLLYTSTIGIDDLHRVPDG
jgi:hypothetical protein